MTVVNSQNESILDSAISDLKNGSRRLQELNLCQRRELIDACIPCVAQSAEEWVAAVCAAKRIPADEPLASEEILVGPSSLLRYLRLVSKTFLEFEKLGEPKLPASPRKNSLGRTCVSILPVSSLCDQLIFRGLKAEVWLTPGSNSSVTFHNPINSESNEPNVAGVLGAGNVSAIPATDMLYKIFHDNESVLLKLNPVNEYLLPIFQKAFRPLIDADLLRIVLGGADVGKAIVDSPDIDSLHITGSHITHEAIVWGSDATEIERRRTENRPRVAKPITSELGNVTPWIVVPGNYTQRQLKSQAQHIVASIANNASFNCVATKMIVTSKQWPQRNQFLELIDSLLAKVPPRFAYYPGAQERFERATEKPAPTSSVGTLPWTLLRDQDPADSPRLFQEESFTCVCAETSLESGEREFLSSAVSMVNKQLFGTLSATLTIPNGFRKSHRSNLEQAIADLRYGTVCINQWAGIAYGLMTPPWGGHWSGTIESPASGIGHVHNTFNIEQIDKTVLCGPLTTFPKPAWFQSHKTAHKTAWSLLRFYEKPSLLRLPILFWHALRG